MRECPGEGQRSMQRNVTEIENAVVQTENYVNGCFSILPFGTVAVVVPTQLINILIKCQYYNFFIMNSLKQLMIQFL